MEDKNPRRKIKSREEIVKLVGKRPRKKTVAMCHGTFDVVHPGHIRHLMYVKDKADILVASLTCDAHIKKANMRPYVPEELRALNLAALEMVDYVVIDQEPTPLENIQFLQPDYFAKGSDYSDGTNPKTQEEIRVLEEYGGEVLFTPGDVVYSSSQIIERRGGIRLASEKLKVLMDSEEVTFDDLRGALDKFAGIKVHVLGDTIVDSYVYCSMVGSGSKTPTLSIKEIEKKTIPVVRRLWPST